MVSAPACEKCGRPKATAATFIRWRSHARVDQRSVCWRDAGAMLRPEEEMATADDLRKVIVELRAKIDAMNCALTRRRVNHGR